MYHALLLPAQPHAAAPLRSPTLHSNAAPRCCAPTQPQGAAPTLLRPCTAPRCCAPAQPWAAAPPTFVLSLPDPKNQASTLLRDTSLSLLTHNWRGNSGQVTLARTWLEALSPDVVAEHELGDPTAARSTLPPRYEAHYSSALG